MHCPGKPAARNNFLRTIGTGEKSISAHPTVKARPSRLNWLRISITAAAMAAHVFLALYVSAIRVYPPGGPVAVVAGDVLELRFIEPGRPTAAQVRVDVALPAKPRARSFVAPTARAEPSATPLVPTALAPKPILVTSEALQTSSVPTGEPSSRSFTPPPLAHDAVSLHHAAPLRYEATRFESAWTPARSTAADDVLNRAVSASQFKKTFDLGQGVRLHCATVFFVLPIGCGIGEGRTPPPKSADARLSMPPASPLLGVGSKTP
jgi:hypothetical protein